MLLALVAAVVVLLVLIALLIFLLVLLVVLLVKHDFFLRFICTLRLGRYHRLPDFSGFILVFEENACYKPCNDGGSDPTGCCGQSTGKNSKNSVLCDGLFHTFCQ